MEGTGESRVILVISHFLHISASLNILVIKFPGPSLPALDDNILSIPKQMQVVRDAAAKAIAPIRPADESTKAEPNLLFSAQRTEAGRQLPPEWGSDQDN